MVGKAICVGCKQEVRLNASSMSHPTIQAYVKQYGSSRVDCWCKPCMDQYHIKIANWQHQNNNQGYLCFDWDHILYYRDQTRHCTSCQKDFVFSADEQQHWYETLRIYTDVSPKMCVDCRRKARHLRRITKELNILLEKAAQAPSFQIYQQIADIYEHQLNNQRKAGIYRSKSLFKFNL